MLTKCTEGKQNSIALPQILHRKTNFLRNSNDESNEKCMSNEG